MPLFRSHCKFERLFHDHRRHLPAQRLLNPEDSQSAYDLSQGKEIATVILLPDKLPVDESRVAVRYINGMTVVVIPSSPTRPDRLLAGLNPVLYPL